MTFRYVHTAFSEQTQGYEQEVGAGVEEVPWQAVLGLVENLDVQMSRLEFGPVSAHYYSILQSLCTHSYGIRWVVT